jgi:hypothetical protein
LDKLDCVVEFLDPKHSLTDLFPLGQPGTTSDTDYNKTAVQSDTMDAAGDASGNPSISNVVNNQQGGQVNLHHETDKTGVTDFHRTDAQSASGPPTSANASSVETRGQDRGPVGGVGAVEPSVGAQPDSGANVGSKQQGAEQPLDEPSGEQVDAIKGQKEKHEDAQQDDGQLTEPPARDPNDHSGEPLGTVDHGASGQGQSQEKDNEQEGPSEEKGTGEKWVKSTGVAADGGDFDATKPGAGKEAESKYLQLLFVDLYTNRSSGLLEQAGVHRTQPGLQEAGGDAADPLDPSSKPSIGEKIKEKLHIGHKD